MKMTDIRKYPANYEELSTTLHCGQNGWHVS